MLWARNGRGGSELEREEDGRHGNSTYYIYIYIYVQYVIYIYVQVYVMCDDNTLAENTIAASGRTITIGGVAAGGGGGKGRTVVWSRRVD